MPSGNDLDSEAGARLDDNEVEMGHDLMPKITYIEHGGVEHIINAQSGFSVMEVAKANGIPGIDADCGGSCACATCHVYVDPDWLDRVGHRSENEIELLECVDKPDDTSRLSCQIVISDALDGLIVRMPQDQH